MHPRYLIFVFASGKVFREAVLIINLDALPCYFDRRKMTDQKEWERKLMDEKGVA